MAHAVTGDPSPKGTAATRADAGRTARHAAAWHADRPRRERPWYVLRTWPAPPVLLAALLATLVNWPVLSDIGHRVSATSDDSSLFMWWLANAAAVVDGRAPAGSGLLHTTLMNVPDGVNGAWNTSVLALALPAVPLTLTAGPVVAYNVLIALAPVACTTAAALTARRWCGPATATVTGLVYGFSPFVLGQSQGHLNLAWALLPPIVLGAVWDLATGDRRPWRVGLRVGLAVAFTGYVSSELVASTATVTVVVLLVLAVPFRHEVPRLLRPFGVAGAVAAGVAVVALAPLLRAMLFGPVAPSGEIRPVARFGNDLFDLVRPTITQAVRLPWLGLLPSHTASLDAAEQGLGVGLGLVALVVVTCLLRWPDRRVRVLVAAAATATGVAWLLSLGSVLWVGGTWPGLLLPWGLLAPLPLVEHVLPMRLSVDVWLGLAVLTGLAAHRAAHAGTPRRRTLGVLGVALALLPVVPAPAHARPVVLPEFFSGSGVTAIPAGSLVKTVPRARAWADPHKDEAMAWQAVARMRYRETGGYFIGSATGFPVIYESVPDAYDVLADSVAEGAALPALDSEEAVAARDALVDRGVRYVVVVRSAAAMPGTVPGAGPSSLATWTARLVGSHARSTGGVWLVPVPRG